MVLLSVAGI